MANHKDRRTVHDFFKYHKLLFIITGFGPSLSFKYKIFMSIIVLFHLLLQAMALYGSYLSGNKTLMMSALHILFLCQFATAVLLTRLFCDRSLRGLRNTLITGVYYYANETIDKEQNKIIEGVADKINRRVNAFVYLLCLNGVCNMILFPIAQLLTLPEDTLETNDDLVNPYLPVFLYFPFNTETLLGYCGAYLIIIIFLLSVYGIGITSTCSYLSFTIQFNMQLKLLNYSLTNIHIRAYRMLRRKISSSTNIQLHEAIPTEVLFESRAFQNCLYFCLKASIKHHQALIRLEKTGRSFNGAIILIIVAFGSVIWATILYIVYQRPHINVLAACLVTILTEQTHSLYICYYGQEIISESSKLYMALYDTPWIYCNRNFTKALDIMMCNTINPIKINATVLHVSASLETYADLLSGMYKFMNLARQSDALQ